MASHGKSPTIGMIPTPQEYGLWIDEWWEVYKATELVQWTEQWHQFKMLCAGIGDESWHEKYEIIIGEPGESVEQVLGRASATEPEQRDQDKKEKKRKRKKSKRKQKNKTKAPE